MSDENRNVCRVCGTAQDVRVLRAQFFLVLLCDPCAVNCPVMNKNDQEVRVIAVAMERFPPPQPELTYVR